MQRQEKPQEGACIHPSVHPGQPCKVRCLISLVLYQKVQESPRLGTSEQSESSYMEIPACNSMHC